MFRSAHRSAGMFRLPHWDLPAGRCRRTGPEGSRTDPGEELVVRVRRTPLILSAFVLAGAAAAAAVPAGAATTAVPVFGHEVIIDHQRSGFEPDIVVSSKNVLYSSVPNGSSQAHSFIWNSLDSGE